MNAKEVFALAKTAVNDFFDDYGPSMGAALAYYTVFSIAPLLLIVISVAGLVFGQEAARGEIVDQLQQLMGDQAARSVEQLIESVNQPSTGVLATVIGAGALLIGATTVFAELQNSLDRIWRAPAAQRKSGIWSLLRTRLLSFGLILGVGFLLIASLALSAALAALGKWWAPLFGGWDVLLQICNFLLGFALITLVFAMIYKFMPSVRIEWRDVWIGAAVTSLLFSIGKFLIGLYLGRSSVTSGYGAAGSLVVLLLWVYYSAQIFLIGAEFTGVYAHSHGSMKGRQRPSAAASLEPDAASAAAAREPAAAPAAAAAPASIPVQVAALVRSEPVKAAGVALASGVVLRLAFAVGLAFVSRKAKQRLRRAF
jgi:membrane protein